MLGYSLNYELKVEESRYLKRFKKFLMEQASEIDPKYFITCYYGKTFQGYDYLQSSDYRKRWDRGQVRRTHRFIKNKLRQCFGDVPMVFCIERHKERIDPVWGEMKGAFHTHLYLGEVNDEFIESPNQYLLPLFYKEDDIGVPINMRSVEIENLKLLLINACIRQAQWVGSHPDSLDIQAIVPSEFKNTFHYGLKQINSEDDLNEVIDWENSDFYNPNTKEKIK